MDRESHLSKSQQRLNLFEFFTPTKRIIPIKSLECVPPLEQYKTKLRKGTQRPLPFVRPQALLSCVVLG